MGVRKGDKKMEDVRDEELLADAMTGHDILIYNIKSKLDRFNILVQSVHRENKDYQRLLECYAEDFYQMCRKFYDAERRVSG